MAATAARAQSSIQDAIRACERASEEADQAACELRSLGSIEDQVGDPAIVARIIATLAACRPIAHDDFQLTADIDDAIRELEAIR